MGQTDRKTREIAMFRAFIDTGIFISVLNKEPNYENSAALLDKIMNGKLEAFISVITLSEIISIYSRISEKDAIIAKTHIESIFDERKILPVLKDMAEMAGRIKARHKMSLGDALIIAGAVSVGCNYIVSLDPEIKNSTLIKVKEPKDAL